MASFLKNTHTQHTSPTHRAYVARLYRRSLKTASDWYWQRSEFREKALVIRSLFDAHKCESSPQVIQALLAHTERTLAVYYHPQPYIRPAAPGGTKWERNIPFPLEVSLFSHNTDDSTRCNTL